MNKIYSVLDFGAKPNTKNLQHTFIQTAIDECFLNGGGEVVIPAGKYRVGGIRIRSNVTLHLLKNTVLEGSRDVNDYFILKDDKVEPVSDSELDDSKWERLNGAPKAFNILGSRWHNGIIRAYRAENFSIIGEEGSVIDGMNCYDDYGEEFYRGPHGISIINCNCVVLKGYTVRHSGNWAHSIQDTNNLLIENLSTIAGHDGIHITTCEDVIIRRCTLLTGDDCVAGFNNKNVLVEDCKLNTACSAFRFGGSNVLIHHCYAYAPAEYLFRGSLTLEEKISGVTSNDKETLKKHRYNMLSFFTYFADFSVPNIKNPATNIIIRDCMIENADRFFHFNFSGNEMWQNNKPLLDIQFKNIEAVGISMPLTAYGDENSPVCIDFENICIKFRDGIKINDFMHTANYKRIRFKNVNIKNYTGATLIKTWSMPEKGEMIFDNLNCEIDEEHLIKFTDKEFVCDPI